MPLLDFCNGVQYLQPKGKYNRSPACLQSHIKVHEGCSLQLNVYERLASNYDATLTQELVCSCIWKPGHVLAPELLSEKFAHCFQILSIG